MQKKTELEQREGFESKRSAASSQPPSNPHIPAFVSKVPWYLSGGNAEEQSASGDLNHHKSSTQFGPSESFQTVAVKRGSVGDVKTKFVAGACENCGSTSHKRKDCLERPRKVLAKYSGAKLASDDIEPVELNRKNFEAKRDRWSNFVADDYSVEPPGRKRFADDEAGSSKLIIKPGDSEAFSVAKLRVREDTAKYLLDLSGDSAHYDPKSRSMRDTSGKDEFVKVSGDAEKVMKLRRELAWDRKSGSTTEVSNPTEVALKAKQQWAAKQSELDARRKELEQKYGPS